MLFHSQQRLLSETLEAVVLVIVVNQPPIIVATATVNATSNTAAISADTAFMNNVCKPYLISFSVINF